MPIRKTCIPNIDLIEMLEMNITDNAIVKRWCPIPETEDLVYFRDETRYCTSCGILKYVFISSTTAVDKVWRGMEYRYVCPICLLHGKPV